MNRSSSDKRPQKYEAASPEATKPCDSPAGPSEPAIDEGGELPEEEFSDPKVLDRLGRASSDSLGSIVDLSLASPFAVLSGPCVGGEASASSTFERKSSGSPRALTALAIEHEADGERPIPGL